MIGLAGIGAALLLGVGDAGRRRCSGAVLYPDDVVGGAAAETNPVVDDHIIGALALLGLALVHAGDTFGFGRWWKAQPIVARNRWLI